MLLHAGLQVHTPSPSSSFFFFFLCTFLYPVEPSRPDTKVATYYHYSFTRIIYNPPNIKYHESLILCRSMSRTPCRCSVYEVCFRLCLKRAKSPIEFLRFFSSLLVMRPFIEPKSKSLNLHAVSGAIILALVGRMPAPLSTPSTMARQRPLMLGLLTGSSTRNLYIGTRSAATSSRSHYRDTDAPAESQLLISS